MITLTPIKLGYGLTPEDACFNFITGDTYYVCPLFTTKSGETIDYSIWEDSGATLSVASGFYSDGNIVRYYNSKDGALIGALCEAYICRKSEYLRGCCDNKIYKLKSGKSLPVGALISVKPVYFCYRVISEPTVPLRFSILNDRSGYLMFPSNKQCDAPQCQPCPTTTGTTINDCDPITLFPIEIKCDTINPTEAAPLSGTLSAIVIGGTQPYTYTWTFPNGNEVHTQTIQNVGAGIYHLVVVDRYGDFTGVTDCELTIYIDCTFSGSVTEFTPTTTTTTVLGPCYCYTIENNWGGDLVTTTTTISTCPPYCFENITLTGNGISNVFILNYTDCNGNQAQTLFAPGNIETINTPDIAGVILSWVSGTGTPNESIDYTVTVGECPKPMMLIGDVYLNYYDCEVGMISIIIPNGIIKVCSYTVPTVYPTVTGVTITQTGICQTEPCPTTPTDITTTRQIISTTTTRQIIVTTTTSQSINCVDWCIKNNESGSIRVTYTDCNGVVQTNGLVVAPNSQSQLFGINATPNFSAIFANGGLPATNFIATQGDCPTSTTTRATTSSTGFRQLSLRTCSSTCNVGTCGCLNPGATIIVYVSSAFSGSLDGAVLYRDSALTIPYTTNIAFSYSGYMYTSTSLGVVQECPINSPC